MSAALDGEWDPRGRRRASATRASSARNWLIRSRSCWMPGGAPRR